MQRQRKLFYNSHNGGGLADRAGCVLPEPGVDAGGVEAVEARQRPHLVARRPGLVAHGAALLLPARPRRRVALRLGAALAPQPLQRLLRQHGGRQAADLVRRGPVARRLGVKRRARRSRPRVARRHLVRGGAGVVGVSVRRPAASSTTLPPIAGEFDIAVTVRISIPS